MVEITGLEPVTSGMRSRRSPKLSYIPKSNRYSPEYDYDPARCHSYYRMSDQQSRGQPF